MDTENYGRFVDEGRAYQITTPKTPTTWSNYLWNDGYQMEISQTLQGKSSRVHNYTQSSFTSGYRYFYLKDCQTGQVWNPNYVPLHQPTDKYICEHQLNKTSLLSSNNGIESKVDVFVPTKGCYEYWTIAVKNTSEDAKEIGLYSVFGFDDHGVMGGECVFDEQQQLLYKYAFPYHVFYDDKSKVESIPSYYYMLSDVKPSSYDMSERRFFGGDDRGCMPAAVEQGRCSNIIAEAERFCGAYQYQFVLAKGEQVMVHLQVGIACNKEEILEQKQLLSKTTIDEALVKSDEQWKGLTNSFSIDTPDVSLNYLTNYWLKKQMTTLTRLNRSSTYCPIRNQIQDAMGYALIDPTSAKTYMYEVLSLQQQDGYMKQWRMTDGSTPSKLCLIDHTDGPLWLVIGLTMLIRQNGDLDLLDELIPYGDGGTGTIYVHLKKAILYMSEHLGAHDLCLMGDGDWNDPINGVGRLGRGESTWNTLALIYCIDQFMGFVDFKKEDRFSTLLKEIRHKLDDAVNTHCWDQDRYIAGFDDDGLAIASVEDQDRVFLNAQTWAIMTKVARNERLDTILETLKRLETPFGPLLMDPPFSRWDDRWGRVSVKKSGTTENGSVYCHASMFKAYADATRQDGDALYDTIIRTLPTNPDNPPSNNLQLPLYVSNYYYGLKGSPNYGRSSGHYGTGTVAWLLMAVLEELVGVKATESGLKINPLLPGEWDEVQCKRTYKGATYNVHIKYGSESSIYVNHEAVEGDILPYESGTSYQVDVTLEKNKEW